MREEQKKRRKRAGILAAALALELGAGGCASFGEADNAEGFQNYVIRKEQYVAEYSEQYDYWDVITVEYPVLSGIDEEREAAVNQLFYDTAMDKVYYWHLYPDDEVKRLQREEYQIYCSDVRCSIALRSQYLVSMLFYESYAPVSPVYYAHKTQRSVNVNLLTGEAYEVSDILRIDGDFMWFWCDRAREQHIGIIWADGDTRDTFLEWFLGEDEELNGLYIFRPFFYAMEDGRIIVGISIDPTAKTVVNRLAQDSSYYAVFDAEELEPYRTESDFWELYEQSQRAGEVIPCEDLRDNIWMREESGVWEYY